MVNNIPEKFVSCVCKQRAAYLIYSDFLSIEEITACHIIKNK